MELGDRIKTIRKYKKLTQIQLSQITGVTQAHINRIENNIANPSIPLLEKIASALNIAISELIDTKDFSFNKAYNTPSMILTRIRGEMTFEEFSKLLQEKGDVLIPPSLLKKYEKDKKLLPEEVLNHIIKILNIDDDGSKIPISPRREPVDLSFMDKDIEDWVADPQNYEFIKVTYMTCKHTKKRN